jgi:hypothetical protein
LGAGHRFYSETLGNVNTFLFFNDFFGLTTPREQSLFGRRGDRQRADAFNQSLPFSAAALGAALALGGVLVSK